MVVRRVTLSKSNRIITSVPCLLAIAIVTIGCQNHTDVASKVEPSKIQNAHQSNAASYESDLDQLLMLIRDRLAFMPDVARSKWSRGLPVEDRDRERKVIDRFVSESEIAGLNALWAEKVIAAQILAARTWQQSCFDSWAKSPPDPNTPPRDLQTELRPQIERVTTDLIAVLIRLEPHRTSHSFQSEFSIRSASVFQAAEIPEAVWRQSLSPWDEPGEPMKSPPNRNQIDANTKSE